MGASLVEHWEEFLTEVPAAVRDVYFSERYYRLYTQPNAGEKAACFVYTEGPQIFLMPMILRQLPGDWTGLFDAESAYGYGGPASSGRDSGFLLRARQHLQKTCAAAGIVNIFIRFHPLLKNQEFLVEGAGLSLLLDRATVAVNLALSEKEIWEKEVHSKHRNVIRKAVENGLTVIFDEAWDSLGEFKKLYRQTMDRLGAAETYFFDDSYYENLRDACQGASCLCNVLRQGAIISSCILFWGDRIGHYHLAGSDAASLNYYPNNLMIWEAALYLKKKGLSLFHLGGGTDGSPENTLLSFKRRFSQTTHDFWIGKWVVRPAEHGAIREAWSKANPDKALKIGHLLQCYRY